jgi:hypothetical protein
VFKENKNGGVAATQINVFMYQFTTCFGSNSPSSGDSSGNTN